MRLWERVRKLLQQTTWRVVGLGRRNATIDPAAMLIRDLVSKGAPMSLASVKAAVDAASSADGIKEPLPLTRRTECLLVPMIGAFFSAIV